MATSPSYATLTGSPVWDSGAPFDGWVRLALVLPTNSDGEWPSSVFSGQMGPQRLPIWIEVPIVQGVFNQQTKIWFNSSITPPNTKYVAYWYDRQNRRISPVGISPTPFTVSTASHAITLPTLAAPIASAVIPAPSEVTTRGV